MKKLLILFMITTLLVVGCGNKKGANKEKEPDKKPETEEKEEIINEPGMLPKKEVNGMKFSNVSISYVDDVSTFVGEIKNTTDKTIELDVFEIVLKDKDGKVVTTIPAYVSDKIEAGATLPVVATVNMDLTKVYDVEYKF